MISIANNKEVFDKACLEHNIGLNQSWSWSETRINYTSHRLLHDGFPIIIYERSLPASMGSFGYIPRGLSAEYIESNKINELIDYGKTLNLSHIMVEPNAELSQELVDAQLNLGFKITGKTIQPNQTQLIDLDKDLDDLFSAVKSKRRRDIRKAAKNGLVVEIDNSEAGLNQFNSVMDSIVRSKNYVMHDSSYFKTIYDTFVSSGNSNIFLAKNNGELHGAYWVISQGNTCYELYGGVNQLGAKSRSSFMLKWETIKYAKENGFRYYDHWGVSPVLENGEFDKSDSMYNISEFKKAFGGRTFHFMPQTTYVYDSLKYNIFKIGMNAHKQLVNIKKRI